jgi:membrane-associated PAP2 superfamily phosphatase
MSAAWRRDAAAAVVLLGLLLAWEASCADLVVSAWFGGAQGFPLRDAFLTRDVLHQGGRVLAWLLLGLLLLDALWPLVPGPSRRRRLAWAAMVLALIVGVPLIKRVTLSSCPWDLDVFGGAFPYVPHWDLTRRDGGPGHCFPSGHAVAAFAFLPVYFLWRPHRPRLARLLLVAVLALGLVFGAAQTLRGAHFVSHTLWTAWLCWAACCLVTALAAWRASRQGAAAVSADPPGGAAFPP